MATFTADVPLNMRWRFAGRVVDIVENAHRGIPLAAGTPFTIPDAAGMADAFEEIHGAHTFTALGTISAGIATVRTFTVALIPGLARLP